MLFSVRLGDISTNRQLLNVVTLKDPDTFPITVTVSGGGVVTIELPSLRVDELPDRGLWTVRIILSDLTPWTGYTYSIAQAGEVLDGSFHTLPDNQSTSFAFIVATCDGQTPNNPTNTYRTIRRLVESSAVPVVHMFIVDDVHYTDSLAINDLDTGMVSTGAPQDTGIGTDYAKSWAANYGLIPSQPKWMMPDRQWVYRNLPCCYSGGDHAIAGNWCRGDANAAAAGNKQKKACTRGSGSLEEVAGVEWDAFYGNINPEPLRKGEWYWGKDMGPVRLSLWDMSKFIEPYDSQLPTDTTCYGAQQIADHMSFLDVNSHPFKIACHESGFTLVGQPWLEWHRAEAQAWHDDMASRPNLNGTDGNLISIYGDTHTVHTLKMDEFWAWSAGTLGDSLSTGGRNFSRAGRPWGWGAQLQYAEHSVNANGDRFLHNFMLVTVNADQSPMSIEIAHIDGGRGIVKYSARLDHLTPRNQMVAL